MFRTYDDWKADSEKCDTARDACPRDCVGCEVCAPPTQPDPSCVPFEVPREPPLGTYAATAFAMKQMFPDDGFDWDAWKEEMKEARYNDD